MSDGLAVDQALDREPPRRRRRRSARSAPCRSGRSSSFGITIGVIPATCELGARRQRRRLGRPAGSSCRRWSACRARLRAGSGRRRPRRPMPRPPSRIGSGSRGGTSSASRARPARSRRAAASGAARSATTASGSRRSRAAPATSACGAGETDGSPSAATNPTTAKPTNASAASVNRRAGEHAQARRRSTSEPRR